MQSTALMACGAVRSIRFLGRFFRMAASQLHCWNSLRQRNQDDSRCARTV